MFTKLNWNYFSIYCCVFVSVKQILQKSIGSICSIHLIDHVRLLRGFNVLDKMFYLFSSHITSRSIISFFIEPIMTPFLSSKVQNSIMNTTHIHKILFAVSTTHIDNAWIHLIVLIWIGRAFFFLFRASFFPLWQ